MKLIKVIILNSLLLLCVTAHAGLIGPIYNPGAVAITAGTIGGISTFATSGTAAPTIVTTLTGTAEGSNATFSARSNASGRDSYISIGDNVAATARLGYLSGDMYFWVNGSTRMRIPLATGQVNVLTAMAVGASSLTLTTGAVGMSKMTASASAPGAGGGKLELVCGTNAGTAKLVIAAGTSATVVTVADNIGAGVSGC